MTGWLSKSDRERIEEVAETTKYVRSQEMLSPETDDEDDDE
jgi:hypothetical protein